MTPTASVSGIYLNHPQTRYIARGKIDVDQAEDYAARTRLPPQETERWLRPKLRHDPGEVFPLPRMGHPPRTLLFHARDVST